jgi:RimJ/RimL family protein N-acetyltransferase
MANILLRDINKADLPIFFNQQLEPEANYMAAFTTKHPEGRGAFNARWTKILANENTTNKTILFQGQVAGHISSFIMFGEREVSYWLGKEFWGKGIATATLKEFLHLEKTRPLYGRAARDNLASIRVLEKCGIEVSGYNKDFADGRGEEVEEVILKLKKGTL